MQANEKNAVESCSLCVYFEMTSLRWPFSFSFFSSQCPRVAGGWRNCSPLCGLWIHIPTAKLLNYFYFSVFFAPKRTLCLVCRFFSIPRALSSSPTRYALCFCTVAHFFIELIKSLKITDSVKQMKCFLVSCKDSDECVVNFLFHHTRGLWRCYLWTIGQMAETLAF